MECVKTTATCFVERSLDDLLGKAIKAILSRGENVVASKGQNRELRAVTLELTRPRSRLSRSESRGKVFSALGELLWYLSGSGSTDFIANYIPKYTELDEDGLIFGAYGPRLRGTGEDDQLLRVIQLLRERPSTRKAVIQLFSASDLIGQHKDVPCTCTLQFLQRGEGLELLSYMRSNDVFLGLPHDIFCFTMLQEIVARATDAELGRYVHIAGSLHLYDEHIEAAQHFLDEGWFMANEMPPMPGGDPMPAIESLLRFEQCVRLSANPMLESLPSDPYWSDLANLLVVFRLDPQTEPDSLSEVRSRMSSRVFDVHIDDRIERKVTGP